MTDRPGIMYIAPPFTAGVAVAAAAGSPSGVCVAATVLAAICFAAACRTNGRTTAALMVLFFALGALCHATRGMIPFPREETASPVLGKLTAVIKSIRFRHHETNALLLALLTGQKEGLARDTVSAFRAAGASHILALSGLHLGIIYLIISKLLAFLGNSRAAAALRSFIIVALSAFYVFMTGASPSLVRAFLFITLSETARHCPGRRKTPLSGWCTALMIQLLFRPEAISSVGFQLSYLAMLGIFTLFPYLEGWYTPASGKAGKRDPLRLIWKSVALSVSCQVFTAPLVWFTFHTFPRYFLITNLTTLPLTEGLMVCGIATAALAAAGISAPLLTGLTDLLSVALIGSLGTIASM